jgi:hypothetical protein
MVVDGREADVHERTIAMFIGPVSPSFGVAA